MRPSVYVAGSSRELERGALVMRDLREGGVRVTSTWPENIQAVGKSNEGLSRSEAIKAADGCIKELQRASHLLLLVPSDAATIGAFIEYGMVLAYCKPLIVVDPRPDRSVFWRKAARIYATDREAVVYLMRC